jgi:hypothetical protein
MVARSVHRGAAWRRVQREGWVAIPGLAHTVGILAILGCLAVGGGVYLPASPGLFRGGEIRERAAFGAAQALSGPLSPSGTENGAMRAITLSAAMAGVMAVSGLASAQDAAEWKASNGGNGHWYQRVTKSISWNAARVETEARGGHLVTITSQAESNHITSIGAADHHIGGLTDLGRGCSASGWRWVTDESMVFYNWASGEPNAYCNDSSMALAVWGGYTGRWNNIPATDAHAGYIIEWDADCNGDGLVDYGQIVAGELADANGNNIPDCCEYGSTCTNVAVNGGFEAGTPLNACTSEVVTSGNAIGTGWMVSAGSVQRVRASSSCAGQGAPKYGDFLIDLLDAGEIRQTVATTPGRTYRLTFWMSGDCAGGPTIKRVAATLGSASQNFDHTCFGSATQAWRGCALEFSASGALTTLSLKSLAGGASNGPLVDGVHVEDISFSCPGDIDGDGEVSGGDVSLVLLNFGACPN